MRRNIEAKHQKAYFDWVRLKPDIKDYIFHIPNGGSRHPIEARNLKLQGVKAGVSDIFIACPSGQYHGCWLDVKSPKPARSKLTHEQGKWLEQMKAAGYQALVCYGVDELIDSTLIYLSGRGKEKMKNFKWGKKSLERLAECDKKIQRLFEEVILEAPIDMTILCGHRTEKEQDEAYQRGKSKLMWPDSNHNKNPSLAIDVVPYPVDWGNIDRFIVVSWHIKLVAWRLGIEVKWGGDWTSLKDYPHWEV